MMRLTVTGTDATKSEVKREWPVTLKFIYVYDLCAWNTYVHVMCTCVYMMYV